MDPSTQPSMGCRTLYNVDWGGRKVNALQSYFDFGVITQQF